jgi:diguanylate cyclase
MEERQRYIRIEKIRLLYRHSMTPAILSGIASFFVVFALWSTANHHELLIWLGITVFFAFVRIALLLNFQYANPQGDRVLAWEKPYAISLFIVFLVWGVGLLLIMPKDNLASIFIVNTFAVGLACAAISWYNPIQYIQVSSISIALVPMIVTLLTLGRPETLWVGIAACFLYVSCILTGTLLQRSLNGNLELTYDLEQAIQNAEMIASTDMLTGLKNRRAFFDEAVSLLAHCKNVGSPISVMMFDVDHFKIINDKHGHAAGDVALQHVANLLRTKLRNTDISCRFGGEEFAVMLPNTPSEAAQITAEKLRALIETTPVVIDAEKSIALTASFGVADVGETLDELLNYADQAMYQAKNSGRNLVGMYLQPSVSTPNQIKVAKRQKNMSGKPRAVSETARTRSTDD